MTRITDLKAKWLSSQSELVNSQEIIVVWDAAIKEQEEQVRQSKEYVTELKDTINRVSTQVQGMEEFLGSSREDAVKARVYDQLVEVTTGRSNLFALFRIVAEYKRGSVEFTKLIRAIWENILVHGAYPRDTANLENKLETKV